METLQKVGTISQPKGLKGEVKAAFEPFFIEFWQHQAVPHLYLSNSKGTVPYFVQQRSQPDAKGVCAVQFEDVTTKAQAEQLRNSTIWFEKNAIAQFFTAAQLDDYDDQGWDFLVGYTLISSDDETIGTITDVFYLPQHELAAVDYQGKEVLIPLHEDIIELLDEDARILVMELPDGLLDL